MLPDTTLTKTQFRRLDRLCETNPEAKVIAWNPRARGPILAIGDFFYTLLRRGVLTPLTRRDTTAVADLIADRQRRAAFDRALGESRR